ARFIRDQVGHSHAATTAIYISVSDDFKDRLVRAAIDEQLIELGGGRIGYEWRLRVLMAQRGMFKATDLQPRLADHGIELSASQVWRMVTGRPERLNLRLLVVLCEILDCQPGE